ncbi:MAG: hexose kinase [Phycisphaerales bacterium]|nr:MAG: hexose kinase [Phycisphaerales bacterium]
MNTIVTVTLNTSIDRLIEVGNFHVGGHLKGRLLRRVPAGKGVNVSRALSSLGVASIATGFVGCEELDQYDRSFDGQRVQPQFLAVRGITRENITLIDPQAHNETHIRDTGIVPSETDLERLRRKIDLLAKPGAHVIFSGSLPPGVENDYAVELVDITIRAGARVIIDAPGDFLRAVRTRDIDLLKPNVQELGEMHETDSLSDDRIVTLGRALSESIRVVMVTCGSAGGYLFVNDSAFLGQVDVAPELIRSTVGCGDAMLAAFVTAQIRGDNPVDSYRFALAVASAAATHEIPGTFESNIAEQMLALTSVEPVS